jgi:hypothetical protein
VSRENFDSAPSHPQRVSPQFYTVRNKLTTDTLGSGVADPDRGCEKKSGSGSGMNNPDHISESLETIFWGKNT